MKPASLFLTEESLGINADLYELTMALAYFEAGCTTDRATFEVFAPKLSTKRNFYVAAGLEQVFHFLKCFKFGNESIEYLKGLPVFRTASNSFFEYLRNFEFTGDVYAMPEGTVFFAKEPIVQIAAPIIEAQIIETYLINCINFQSMVASKAARICLAAEGKPVICFGARRAHGPQAAVLAARAAFIGGCQGTSNLLAGYEMGIPVYGTMGHSFIQFFGDENKAFQQFHNTFGRHSTILVDTYDTLAGVKKALALPADITAIRLDSGDLQALAVESRKLLDESGRTNVRILVSGDLNEEKICALERSKAPIDCYCVGTELIVSADAPTCNLVYKLVEIDQQGTVRPRIKASEKKATMPYRKNVFRQITEGHFSRDLLYAVSELPQEGAGETVSLLHKYVENGKVIKTQPNLSAIKKYASTQIVQLPDALRQIHGADQYPVEYSSRLHQAQRELEKEFRS